MSHKTLSFWDSAAGLLTPILRRRGFPNVSIIRNWPLIVGDKYAKSCYPKKITWQRKGKGILVVYSAPSVALELQHLAASICARTNEYNGFPIVARMQLIQDSALEQFSATNQTGIIEKETNNAKSF